MANTEKSLKDLVINVLTTAQFRKLQEGQLFNREQLYSITDLNFYTQAEVDQKIKTAQSGEAGSVQWNNVTGKPNMSDYLTSTEVEQKITDLINSAPAALDTLKEIAEALNNDPNFATTITNLVATKANKSDVTTELNKKADATVIPNLATKQEMTTALNRKVDTTTLSNYATVTALNTKANSSDLANYALTTSLPTIKIVTWQD